MDIIGFFGWLLGKFVDFLSLPIPLGDDIEVSLFGVSVCVALGTILFAIARHFFVGDK